MSPDPYDGSMDLGNPQSFNRYTYVGNNPLGFTDPSGLKSDCGICDFFSNIFGFFGAAATAHSGRPGGSQFLTVSAIGETVYKDGIPTIPIYLASTTLTHNPSTWPGFFGYLGSWIIGSAPTAIYYGSNDPATDRIKDTRNVRRAVRQYVKQGCPGSPDAPFTFNQGHLDALNDTFFRAPINPTQLEVGGYLGDISTFNEVTTITINNPSSFSSFDAESTFFSTHYSDNLFGTAGPLHTINQTFQWTEAGLCGK